VSPFERVFQVTVKRGLEVRKKALTAAATRVVVRPRWGKPKGSSACTSAVRHYKLTCNDLGSRKSRANFPPFSFLVAYIKYIHILTFLQRFFQEPLSLSDLLLVVTENWQIDK
jgi:hypothetical protein